MPKRRGRNQASTYNLLLKTDSTITIPQTTDLDLGSSNFTIDFWINLKNRNTRLYVGKYLQAGIGYWILDFVFYANILWFEVNYPNGSGVNNWWIAIEFDLNLSINTDYHLALVKNGTSLSNWNCYLNGVAQNKRIASFGNGNSASNSVPNFNCNYYIGYNSNQIISHLRQTLAALWTANFDPSAINYSSLHAQTKLYLPLIADDTTATTQTSLVGGLVASLNNFDQPPTVNSGWQEM